MPPPPDTEVGRTIPIGIDSGCEALHAAKAAAVGDGLGFAGNLSALQASIIVKAGIGRLIDVRADVELDLEGYVPGSTHVPWVLAPEFEINPAFIPELEGQAGKDEVLLFHCRRGSRSAVAASAATTAGFRNAFSVADGFDELLALCVDRSTTTW
jgi:rhodanese-related sulfurtransferase